MREFVHLYFKEKLVSPLSLPTCFKCRNRNC